MSVFEVVRGVEGCCLLLDDLRIAGPKPWGGGTVIHAWETDKEYKAVDTRSRWFELFGTPESAARTIAGIRCDDEECGGCALYGAECSYDSDVLLEWLRGDA